MAKFYPEVFPNPQAGNPEFEVYQALRVLNDNYSVFYSKRLRGGPFSKRECEIDFVITNQRDVVICLEVKGGLIHYEGSSDKWYQNGEIMKENPDVQAQKGCHALLALLPKELLKATFDWGLCFPQCCLQKQEGTIAINPEQLIDEKALISMSEAIQKLESHSRAKFKKPGWAPSDYDKFLNILTKNIGFTQVLGVRIAREAKQIIQITDEQCEILEEVDINHRMIIHGCAGSGKTVMAQTFAKRLLSQNRSVLLVFYNKGIASTVRRAFDRKSNIQVSTFSSFAKRLLENVDPNWWDSHSNQRDDDFWHVLLPARLFDIPPKDLPLFNDIIVDEGQDFKPEWYEFLQSLLVPGEDSHFTVFLDVHQDIFGHWKQFPCSPTPAKKLLNRNCRNTRTIVDFLESKYPTGMKSYVESPFGTPIVIRNVKNEVEEQAQIVRDIKALVYDNDVPPSSIVILISGPKSESSLRDVKAVANIPLVSTYDNYDQRVNVVYYSTIDIFKGMEADIVLLVLGKSLDNEDIPQILYVQGSRAKHVLYIYARV